MTHQCFICRTDNPDRIISGDVARFEDRFVGPPARAHGGIAVGATICPAVQRAAAVGTAHPMVRSVSGRLHSPVPLRTPLNVHVSERGPFVVRLSDQAGPVVTANVEVGDHDVAPGAVIQEPSTELSGHLESMAKLANADPDGPTLLEIYAQCCAEVGVEDEIFCYGCSGKPHALKLHNRSTDQGDLWTQWLTEPYHADAPGRLAASVVVAALDCSNLWVLVAREPKLGLVLRMEAQKVWITGTHTVHFLRAPAVDGDYRVVTRFLRRDGRKAYTLAALLDRNGTAYAIAEAISLLIDVPEEMRL